MPIHLFRTYGRTMKGKSIRINFPNSSSPEKRFQLGLNNDIKKGQSFDNKEDEKEFVRLNNLVEKLMKDNQSLKEELNQNKKLLAQAIQLKQQQDLIITSLKEEVEKLKSPAIYKSPQKSMVSPCKQINSPRNSSNQKTLEEEIKKLKLQIKVLVNVNMIQKEQQIELQNQAEKLNQEIQSNKNHKHGLECLRSQKENKEKLEITIELNNILKLKLINLEQQFKECQQKLQSQQQKHLNFEKITGEQKQLKQQNEEISQKYNEAIKKLEEYKQEQMRFQILYFNKKQQLKQINEQKNNDTPKNNEQLQEELGILREFNKQLQKQNEDFQVINYELKLKIREEQDQLEVMQRFMNENAKNSDLISQIHTELNLDQEINEDDNQDYIKLKNILQKVRLIGGEKEKLKQILEKNQEEQKLLMDQLQTSKYIIEQLNEEIAESNKRTQELLNQIEQFKGQHSIIAEKEQIQGDSNSKIKSNQKKNPESNSIKRQQSNDVQRDDQQILKDLKPISLVVRLNS